MTCKEEKKALRQAVQQGVRQLPEDYCKAADAAIFEHIRALPEYAAAKTVFAVVRHSDDICFVFEGDDADNRPENFFLGNAHVVLHVSKDGRFNEAAFVQTVFRSPFTTANEARIELFS